MARASDFRIVTDKVIGVAIARQAISDADNYSQPDMAIAHNGRMKKVDIRQIFASNLRARMAERGYNQTNMATWSGVSQAHISEILRGVSKISLDLVAELAYGLRCEPWELLVDSEATRKNILSKMLGLEERPPPPEPLKPVKKVVAAQRRKKPKNLADPRQETGGAK